MTVAAIPQRLEPPVQRLLYRRLWMAQGLDAATFLAFILIAGEQYLGAEQNPMVAGAYALAGVWGFLGLKLGIVALAQYLGTRGAGSPITHQWYWPIVVVLLSVAAGSGIVGAGFNIASLVAVLRAAG